MGFDASDIAYGVLFLLVTVPILYVLVKRRKEAGMETEIAYDLEEAEAIEAARNAAKIKNTGWRKSVLKRIEKSIVENEKPVNNIEKSNIGSDEELEMKVEGTKERTEDTEDEPKAS